MLALASVSGAKAASLKMTDKKTDDLTKPQELPDEWWYRVYAGVIVTTVFVILALWAFSRYFSG